MAGTKKYLDVDHILQDRYKDIHAIGHLRLHLLEDHLVRPKGMNTGQLAKYHLLAHTIDAFPELQEMLEL